MSAALEETLKGARLLHRLALLTSLLLCLVGVNLAISSSSLDVVKKLATISPSDYETFVNRKVQEAIKDLNLSENLLKKVEVNAKPYITEQRKEMLLEAFLDFERRLLRHAVELNHEFLTKDDTIGQIYRLSKSNKDAMMKVPNIEWLGKYIGDAAVKYFSSPEDEWQSITITINHRAGVHLYPYFIYFQGAHNRAIDDEIKTEFIPVDGSAVKEWLSMEPFSTEMLGGNWQRIENLTPEAAVQELSYGKAEVNVAGVYIDPIVLLIASPVALLGINAFLLGYISHLQRIWSIDAELAKTFPWLPINTLPLAWGLTALTTWFLAILSFLSLISYAFATNAGWLEWFVLLFAGGINIVLSVIVAVKLGKVRRTLSSDLPPAS
ncbi:MAG: hypothetical protein NXH96_08280 [Alteromonadaceae bacterium]|nr:hypothetical protein [Alteromonadaceae bacterium]